MGRGVAVGPGGVVGRGVAVGPPGVEVGFGVGVLVEVGPPGVGVEVGVAQGSHPGVVHATQLPLTQHGKSQIMQSKRLPSGQTIQHVVPGGQLQSALLSHCSGVGVGPGGVVGRGVGVGDSIGAGLKEGTITSVGG